MSAYPPPSRLVRSLRAGRRLTLRHRLTVTLPMSLLGLLDNAITLLTFGYLLSDMAMWYGVQAALRNHRRAVASAKYSVNAEDHRIGKADTP